MESGSDLLSRAVSSQVPSALRGLTSVFGMGTGGSLSSLPPEIVNFFLSQGHFRALTTAHRMILRLTVQLVSFFAPLRFTFVSLRFAGPALNQALDLLVSTTSTPCGASSVDLLPGSPPGVLLLADGSLILEVGFTLRCFQRLSHPYFASLLCRWHDNSCTSGMSIPVLSY